MDEEVIDTSMGIELDEVPDGIDLEELEKGKLVEMREHGLSEAASRKIALDHLQERADYYSRDDDEDSAPPSRVPRSPLSKPVEEGTFSLVFASGLIALGAYAYWKSKQVE